MNNLIPIKEEENIWRTIKKNFSTTLTIVVSSLTALVSMGYQKVGMQNKKSKPKEV
jgi:hypothetical protein